MEWLRQGCALPPAAQGCPRPGRGTLLLLTEGQMLFVSKTRQKTKRRAAVQGQQRLQPWVQPHPWALSTPDEPHHSSNLLAEVLTLSLLLYPVLRSLALQLHSAITGSYVPGTHSVAFINCLNEQIAKDIARAIMDKKLAACVNILPKSLALYFWKGELEESTEILLLVKTRTSKISELSDYVRSIHPFEIPEIISLPIDQGNPLYLKWLEESVPRD